MNVYICQGSVQESVEEQEQTFGRLTRQAVFLQDKVPVCISEEKEAMIARNNERATLANIWRGPTQRTATPFVRDIVTQ